jgi:radical SAM superfamily enzyme YgiQ (UPF0313 family)
MIKTLIYNLPPLDKSRPSLSGAIIAAVCASQGHDCMVVDLQFELDQFLKQQNKIAGYFDDVFYEHSPSFSLDQTILLGKFIDQHLQNLHSTQFDYVFVSLFSYLAQNFGQIFLPQLRKHSRAKIIVGGAGLVYVTNSHSQLAFAEDFKAVGIIDEFITGEAEESIPMYLKQGHGPGIGNYSFKQIDDLDKQPWPDYSYYNLNNYSTLDQQELAIIGSRGCVRSCTFCDVAKTSPKYRYRSGKNIAKEIIHHYETHGVTRYYFADSLINGSFKAFNDMCNSLAAYHFDRPISWSGQYIIRSRATTPRDHFEMLRKSGCDTLFVGLESGSDRVRQELGKPFTNDDTEYYLENFSANQIRVLFLMFTGYVSETKEDHAETLTMFPRWQRFVADGTIQGIETLNILGILPETKLAEMAIDNKWLFVTDHTGAVNLRSWVDPQNPNYDFLARISRHIELMEHAMKYKWPLWNGALAMQLYEQAVTKFVQSPRKYVSLSKIPIQPY